MSNSHSVWNECLALFFVAISILTIITIVNKL
jgi:hypothetical protein